MNDLKRFDMNGTPHVSGQYCNAQEAADLIESQQQRIAELEQERDAIAAHVERLRGAINRIDTNVSVGYCEEAIAKALMLAESEPTTSLNAVRREVYSDGYYEGMLGADPEIKPAWAKGEAEDRAHTRYPDKEDNK